MSLLDKLQWRYATKRMNGTKVPQEKIDNILEAIRLAPTSYGFQPFKVIVVEDIALKNKIFETACQQPQIKESSHVLVFAAVKNIDEAQVDKYMSLISKTRNIPAESLSGFKSAFSGIISGDETANFVWTARQAYIAFGVGIVAAAFESVDATPMEGFDPIALNQLLGLNEKNLSAVTILTLGYRDEANDLLAKALKVRKNKTELFDFR